MFWRGGPPEKEGAMRYRTPLRAGDKSGLAVALKTCPRCLGDLVLQQDIRGGYYVCLQCGAEIEPRLQEPKAS